MRGGRGFLLPALLVVVPFVLVRVPYLWGHGVPGVQGDTAGYFEPILQILDGEWPTFIVRTPGYPLFLLAVRILSRDAMAVVAAQQLVSLVSQLWLVSGVYALRPSLAPWAALATAVSKASLGAFDADTSIMADSLYSSCLLVVAGFILRLFSEGPRIRDFVGASLSMAAAIITRPAGLFLVGTWLVLLLLVWLRGTRRGGLIALWIPFPATLLGLCAYNAATVGDFSVSPWGTASILGATTCYWRTSDAYPPGVNWVIGTMQGKLTPTERQTLDESWNLSALGNTYAAHFNDVHNVGLLDDYEQKGSRQLLRRIALDAIKARPDLYAKFVASQLYSFLGALSGNRWGFYKELIARRACVLVNPGGYRRKVLLKVVRLQLPDVRSLGDLEVGAGVGGWIGPQHIQVRRPLAVRLLTAVYGVFRHTAWVWLWLLVLVGSGWRVLQARGRDPGASAVLAVATLHLGAGLLVSLVEIGLYRYSTSTEFAIYLSVALAPLVVWPQSGLEARQALPPVAAASSDTI